MFLLVISEATLIKFHQHELPNVISNIQNKQAIFKNVRAHAYAYIHAITISVKRGQGLEEGDEYMGEFGEKKRKREM